MKARILQFFTKIRNFFDTIYIPFLGISLYKMFEIYGTGIFQNKLGKQASSISWSFFLSLFPFILFLLSLLPYLPHYNRLLFYILEVLLPEIMPENILPDITDYIRNTLLPNLKSLNSFTAVIAMVFGTNGTYTLINGFNEYTTKQRGFIKEYAIALGITIAFTLLIIITFLGIYYSEIVLKLFTPSYDISWFSDNLSKMIGFISFPIFYFFLLCLFYWAGCVKMRRFVHAVPGAILTTILFILVTYFFAIYLKNFARYNVFYGSIGSIIIVMIWININIILILLGNQLNIAIRKVRMEKILSEKSKEIIRN